MKYESSIHVTNSSDKERLFHLEPWGDQIEMPSVPRYFYALRPVERVPLRWNMAQRKLLFGRGLQRLSKSFPREPRSASRPGSSGPLSQMFPRAKRWHRSCGRCWDATPVQTTTAKSNKSLDRSAGRMFRNLIDLDEGRMSSPRPVDSTVRRSRERG